LYPIRNTWQPISGSEAQVGDFLFVFICFYFIIYGLQRDIFAQLLIHACIRSPNPRDHARAKCVIVVLLKFFYFLSNFNIIFRQLLHERNANRPNSPLTQRLIAQWHLKHTENDVKLN
jgi:hypothetical protein